MYASEAGREKFVRENASASSSADGTPNPVLFLGLVTLEGFTRAELITRAGGAEGGFTGLRHVSASRPPCCATWRMPRSLSATHSLRDDNDDVGWTSSAVPAAGNEAGKTGAELHSEMFDEAPVRKKKKTTSPLFLRPLVFCAWLWLYICLSPSL